MNVHRPVHGVRDLSRLFRPRSIALIGGSVATAAALQCRRMGFAGEVWRVHPTKSEDEGFPCVPDVASLPGVPDAVFLGINRALTVDVVAQLSRLGAGGVVCYASGFSESGEEGAGFTARLLEAAGSMPLIGPNCYGMINYLDGALLWPDQHGGERTARGVAILTQSSNIAINLTMQRRGLPIAYVATAGNQAQTDLSEIGFGLLADERVTALGFHVEGLKNADTFARLALEARARKVPVIALAIGRSEQARSLTMSHTASLAGEMAGTRAFFTKLGVPLVRSLTDFLETLKLLHVHGPLPGGDMCSMSCSGGEAALMADSAFGLRARFRPLTPEQKRAVEATTHPLVTVSNPLDYHTFSWANEPEMTGTFTAMLKAGFDLSMLVLDFPRGDRCSDADWAPSVRALETASRTTGGRAAVVASLPENLTEAHAADLMARGIAPLCGIEEALAAVEAAAEIGEAWRKPEPKVLPPAAPGGGALRLLSEAEAKQRLAAFGLTVPQGRVVRSADEAAAAAAEIGYPVALKALGVAHKTEQRALRLGLKDERSVREAAAALLPMGDGLLVEAMVYGAVAEIILGIVNDPQYGLLLTLGAGGILTELLDDSHTLLLPVSREEIAEAMGSLRVAKLLNGYRGGAKADMDAAVDAALAVARFAEANAASLRELDVNPLMLREQGKGAVAADALIRMEESGT
jgi:acyl-CoA synthetase (NDP forming)